MLWPVNFLLCYLHLLAGRASDRKSLTSAILISRIISGIIICSVLAGCGRVGPPIIPERLNPMPVEGLAVDLTVSNGVALEWIAPRTDVQNEPLEKLIGYRVERAVISGESLSLTYAPSLLGTSKDINEPEFTEIAVVEDETMARLQRAQEKARAEERPSRKVKLSIEERKVTFVDVYVREGEVYLYRVLPFNQRRFDGSYRSIVKVLVGTPHVVESLSPQFEEEEENVNTGGKILGRELF